jgi:hypothetical protein
MMITKCDQDLATYKLKMFSASSSCAVARAEIRVSSSIIASRYFSFCRIMVRAVRVCWGRDWCLHCVAYLFPSLFGAAAISVNVQRYQSYTFDGL